MALLNLRGVSFSWDGSPLLDEVDLQIERGERIGLLGRNGAGKSTLMKIVAGELAPDHGEVRVEPTTRIARLVQEVPGGAGGQSVAELITEGYPVDSAHAWEADLAVKRVLSRMSLDGSQTFSTLSSGMKRRVLLARSLVHNPEILLLDEPTNHLDIASIAWLEGFLQNFEGALLFVTHDRAFLKSLAQRIIEVDRGRLFDWTCGYEVFLQRKQAQLDAEEKQNAHFDKKLAAEEVWIRTGIKARRTRNEGRVRALKKLREERRQRRERVGNVKLRIGQADPSGQLVVEMKNVTFSYPNAERIVVRDFSTLISRGDKIGVIGPNGAGKSTLLKLILGELQPTAGTIRRGTNLQIVYFDQLREQIDGEKTVIENVGEGQETLTIGGKAKHIYGYLQDFLFTPERARQLTKMLSGGERNRLLLARIFKRPSNLLVLDEPTNDLDAETLDLLEELVSDYSGTVLLVSHDREFLNNVVTSTIHVGGDGEVYEYDGGYDDFLAQQESKEARPRKDVTPSNATAAREPTVAAPSRAQPAKLSYKERSELAELPGKIEALEKEQADLFARMTDPGFYKQTAGEISASTRRVDELAVELAAAYDRWSALAERE